MAKKKNDSHFFEGFYKALGSFAGLKIAALLFALVFGGVYLKSCNEHPKSINGNDPGQSIGGH